MGGGTDQGGVATTALQELRQVVVPAGACGAQMQGVRLMKCERCGKEYPKRTGRFCGACLPDDQLTPLQLAKRYNEPYVKLVIDQRHLKPTRGGKITVEGPVSDSMLAKANALLSAIVDGEGEQIKEADDG